jgi:hypothetical protein
MPTSGTITALELALSVSISAHVATVTALLRRLDGATRAAAITAGGAAFGASLALAIAMMTMLR